MGGWLYAECTIIVQRMGINFRRLAIITIFLLALFMGLLVLFLKSCELPTAESQASDFGLLFMRHEEVNKRACLRYLNMTITGRFIRYEKRKTKYPSLVLEDSTFVYPEGLSLNMYQFQKGDSIIKRAGTFDYVVFRGEGFRDSLIIGMYDSSYDCDYYYKQRRK